MHTMMPKERQFEFADGPDAILRLKIREYSDPNYGLFIWPSSRVLAHYIWRNRADFANKKIIELGAGTSLPGLVAAAVGARVTLTDREDDPQILENCRANCTLNQLQCNVVGLSWGTFSTSLFKLETPDIILGADVLYDSQDFEKVIATVVFFMRKNPRLCFVTTYEDRSSHFQLEYLVRKYDLLVEEESLESFCPPPADDDPEAVRLASIRLFIIAKRLLDEESTACVANTTELQK